MSKTTKIIIGVAVVALIIIAIVLGIALAPKGGEKGNNSTKLGTVTSEESLIKMVDKIYAGVKVEMIPSLQTTALDVKDADMVKMFTGLDNGNDLEYLVISQPMMSSQAYQFVLAKVKDGVNANTVAKKMSEQVDTRRWVCVEAEKVYANNSGNIVCLVMGDHERLEATKAVYDSFKEQAGTVGELHEKTVDVGELPPDMY